MQETLQRLKADQKLVFPELARYCLGPNWSPDDIPQWVTAAVPTPIQPVYDFTKVDAADMVLLDGFAGTGKTTTINRLVEYINKVDPQIKFGMTAPTNKAVRILKKYSECKVELKFGTIHSFLGLKEETNWVTGERTFVPDKYARSQVLPIHRIQVLILDETSQMKREIFKFLKPYVANGLKIIFMGDDKQIPPVGEEQSIPFLPMMRKSNNIYKLSLTEIQRQAADNPIVQYAAAIRDQYESSRVKFDLGDKDHNTTGIAIVPKSLETLKPIFTKYFCTNEFKADSDFMKVICWRNSTAKYFNPVIRKLVFGMDPVPNIMEGEKLIVEHTIFQWNQSDGKWEILYPANEELEVFSVRIADESVKYKQQSADGTRFNTVSKKFKIYQACVNVPDGDRNKDQTINIIHDDDEVEYNAFIKNFATLASKCDDPYQRKLYWKAHYDLQKPFANVGYNYCITAHKAQGSSYVNIMVQEWDIDESRDYKERNRVRYVAITRARKKLYIVK
jgi:exodeoxyribonuclease-5